MKPTHLLLIALLVGACDDKDDDTDVTDTDDGETDETDDTDVAATPRGPDDPPTPGAQIDRIGRPAINTALNNPFVGRTSEARDDAEDAYNAATPEDAAAFDADFQASLGILDALDATCGNQLLADADAGDRYGFLAGVLLDDRLYVNTATGTCGVYLGVEAEVVGALEAGQGGCGGRTPTDDVIERSYSVLAAGVLTGVDDGVPGDDVASSGTFPFLAAPAQ